MLEKPIRTKVLKWLNSLDQGCFFVSPPGSFTGLPDIVGVLRGKYVAVEVKGPGGTVKKHQEYVHKKLRAAGAIVFVAHSLSEAKLKLQYWLGEKHE